MSITSIDIQQQSFEMARHGYDVQEVDVFLERIAAEVDEMTRQNDAYASQVEDLQYQLQEARSDAGEKTVETTPVAVADDSAFREAIKNAEEKADRAEEQLRQSEERISRKQADLDTAERKIADLEERLEKAGNDAETISGAFIAAQRSANAIKEEARAEGEKIYRDAEAKSRELLQNAQIEKQAVEKDTEALKDGRDKFAKDYIAMLKTFMSDAQSTLERSKTGVTAAAMKASAAAERAAAAPVAGEQKLDLDLADAPAAQKQAPTAQKIPSYKSAYADVPVDGTGARQGTTFEYGEADGIDTDDID